MRVALVVLVLVLAGCRQAPAPDAPPEAATSPAPDVPAEAATSSAPSSSLAPVATLEGEWRVAGIDGAPFDEPYGLALSADADEIWWEPRCANMARSYRITGTRIAIGEAEPLAPVEPGEPSPPICTINPPTRLRDVARSLDAADTVGRTLENGVLLSGGGHSMLLFSQ